MRAYFRGKAWRIIHKAASVIAKSADAEARRIGEAPPGQVRGLTDGPSTKNKAMWINKNLSGVKLLDTYIHEALHCCIWDLSEDTVHETANDLARFLWRLGYRKP